MQLEKKFFRYEADVIIGTAKEIKDKLNSINEDPEQSVGFTSNLVKVSPDGHDPEFAIIVQVKIPKRR